jgi:hypothetical protein
MGSNGRIQRVVQVECAVEVSYNVWFMSSAGRGAVTLSAERLSASFGLASATAVGKRKNNGVADPTPSISMLLRKICSV